MTHSTLRAAFHPRQLLAFALAAALVMAWSPSVALGAVEEHLTIPLEGMVFEDLCGEDLVHTAGNLHILVTSTVNDNHVSGHVHIQPQGAKLVGLTTGAEYVGTGGQNVSFSESLNGGVATFTLVGIFRIVGKGKAPTFVAQLLVHTTINANGDVTADVEFVGEGCE